MNFFIENENLITVMSRFGKVPNYTACDKACGAKHFRPFLLRDFFNFADQLNKTNFLSRENQKIMTELKSVRRGFKLMLAGWRSRPINYRVWDSGSAGQSETEFKVSVLNLV